MGRGSFGCECCINCGWLRMSYGWTLMDSSMSVLDDSLMQGSTLAERFGIPCLCGPNVCCDDFLGIYHVRPARLPMFSALVPYSSTPSLTSSASFLSCAPLAVPRSFRPKINPSLPLHLFPVVPSSRSTKKRTGLPGVIPGFPETSSVAITDVFFWTPQVIGGTGFIVSSLLLMLEEQSAWWKLGVRSLGW